MDKISFLKSIREIELDENGQIKAVKGYIQRSTGDMEWLISLLFISVSMMRGLSIIKNIYWGGRSDLGV